MVLRDNAALIGPSGVRPTNQGHGYLAAKMRGILEDAGIV